MKSTFFVLVMTSTVALGACADEDPASIGGPLLPGGAVQTIELTLDAADFLVADTTASGFSRASDTDRAIVARDAGGVLDANALYRFPQLPSAVTYITTTDSVRQDTMPSFIGGRVVIKLDTLSVQGGSPLRFSLYRINEAWDPRTATWDLRTDTLNFRQEWTEPGGTRGELLDTATWSAGSGDSIAFQVDSLTLAIWDDTTNAGRGAMLVAETPGTRVRLSLPVIRLSARPSARPDTVVTVTANTAAWTFVFDPPPAPGPELRVGGIPAWRSFLRFRDVLGEIQVGHCDVAGGPCVKLSDATINYAALLLTPVPASPAYLPIDSVFVDARPVFETPLVPLSRAPLSSVLAGRTFDPIPASAFALPGAPVVELAITSFVANLLSPPDDDDALDAPDLLALLAAPPESRNFGYAAFASRMAAGAPRLRLIVTFSSEVEIR